MEIQSRDLSGPQMGGVNFPDPTLIFGDGSWKAMSTSSDGKGVPIATSDDAFTWNLTPNDALPDKGSWVDPNDQSVWAPDLNKNDAGVYIMYYTARKNGGNHCIGVATSNTAMGPYKPHDQPLVCDDGNGGVIDPSGYDDGKDRWLVWKVDGNSKGGATTCQSGRPSGDYIPTPIKIQRMARDGLTLLDAPKVILDNEGRSNDGVVEAANLYKVPNGDFVVFYSAHCFSSDDYDIEYAWSSTIDGKYEDRGILFRSADHIGIYGPGHCDIDPNGVNMVFHGRENPNDGKAARVLYSATLHIDGRNIQH
ncbi:hypothetical protein LMH87_001066 [Akanthomyces muscarius]|uniref:Glycoside hydrolase family 43 protein n=1 Tax=Akanthomyces muscarius TaxID=2231603 RepID=A0A9W8UPG4_AKAMU|nr:hypothetical protein LMH87_001066 [Akanthomyces muscarius]KAJ4155840.1 hypothetical protein LMH87_001066 [Akanthomyces muscarius]